MYVTTEDNVSRTKIFEDLEQHTNPGFPPAREVDEAYDGSSVPQRRALTARERDMLTRVIVDVLGVLRRSKWPVDVRLDPNEVEDFQEIRRVIDPRADEVTYYVSQVLDDAAEQGFDQLEVPTEQVATELLDSHVLFQGWSAEAVGYFVDAWKDWRRQS